MPQAHVVGSRLAYVVVPMEGTVQRKINTWTKKGGLTDKYAEVPAGYLVYFPRGHVLRLKSKAELRQYKLDKPARIISLQGLHDPNSPIGKVMMADDDAARRGAYQRLEEQVIRMATASSGKVELVRDPRELPQHVDEQ